MLTQDELAYGQQKNREYIWTQVKAEAKERFGFVDAENDDHADWMNYRLWELCAKSNITAW